GRRRSSRPVRSPRLRGRGTASSWRTPPRARAQGRRGRGRGRRAGCAAWADQATCGAWRQWGGSGRLGGAFGEHGVGGPGARGGGGVAWLEVDQQHLRRGG